MELSIWRLEINRMRNSCLHQVVCLSIMTSNSNVIKLDFEYTSTVVAKLVIFFFPRIHLIVSFRFLPIRSPLIKLRKIVLENINNIIFMFNSYLVITPQRWYRGIYIFLSLILCTYLVELRTTRPKKEWGNQFPKNSCCSKIKQDILNIFYLTLANNKLIMVITVNKRA